MKLRMPEMPPATLLAALGSFNLLPAIIFLPTRRRCDEAASEAALSRRSSKDDRREARRDFMNSLAEQHPEIRKHRHWDTIVRGGIASHHAGHLPAWKLVIEKMMSGDCSMRFSPLRPLPPASIFPRARWWSRSQIGARVPAVNRFACIGSARTGTACERALASD